MSERRWSPCLKVGIFIDIFIIWQQKLLRLGEKSTNVEAILMC